MECIRADSTTILPCFIIKGKAVNTYPAEDKWKDQLLGDWQVTNSTKGWTSNIKSLYKLKACLEPETAAKAAGGLWVLICDRHDRQILAYFASLSIDSNSIPLITPPLASHLLQP